MEDRIDYNKKITFRNYLTIVNNYFWKILLAFLIIMLVTSLLLAFDVGGISSYFENYIEGFMDQFSGLIDSEGNINTVGLILNNVRVTFIAFLIGIVPFIFLPAFALFVNALIVGLLLGLVAGKSTITAIGMFFLGILPHGIIELPAIFISVATGLILCTAVNKAIRKSYYRDLTVKEAFINGLKTIVFVCVPMMIVAGVIETKLTPLLLEYFMQGFQLF